MALDFEKLKNQFIETVGSLADKGTAVAKDLTEKGTATAKKVKLAADLSSERDALNKAYAELGKLYYEKYGEDYDTDFTEAVMKAKLSLETIAAKSQEAEELNTKADEDIEVEVVVEETVADAAEEVEAEACECTKEAEELSDKAEELKNAAIEKAGELTAAAKDYIEKVGATEKVEEAKAAVKEFAEKAAETVSKKADEVKAALQNTAEEAEEKAEEAKEIVEEVAEEVKEAAEEEPKE